ncbi:hypothetical protein [Roseobacter sp. S98]|uniref:hypothetical protein n=1 Tax=Roseobacter algicola (ex Choi et al. 2025) (nom. illeg.) TaxID=3092138 RepID=UPI0035C6EC0B
MRNLHFLTLLALAVFLVLPGPVAANCLHLDILKAGLLEARGEAPVFVGSDAAGRQIVIFGSPDARSHTVAVVEDETACIQGHGGNWWFEYPDPYPEPAPGEVN